MPPMGTHVYWSLKRHTCFSHPRHTCKNVIFSIDVCVSEQRALSVSTAGVSAQQVMWTSGSCYLNHLPKYIIRI